MQTQLLKIALTTALFAGAAHAVTLNDAKVAFRAGNWKVLRIIDPMTDKINCAGIYKDDNSIQLSADNLIIGVQGGVGLVTLRYGDEPAKDFRLAQDMERRLRAVIISGTDFQELAGSKRLRYSVLTALDNSVSGDLNLEGLTGDDLISVERELTATGTVVVTIQTSQAACLLIASRAAKVPSELIRALPLNEASKLAMSVQGFLLG